MNTLIVSYTLVVVVASSSSLVRLCTVLGMPILLLEAALQLLSRLRSSQKAESVSGLSAFPSVTLSTLTFPETARLIAASSDPELDLDCEAKTILVMVVGAQSENGELSCLLELV